jgi:anaerobic selenocysteine-containing dehydrogenase
MMWTFPRLTRRDFLKTTGYGGAALSLLQPLSLAGKVGESKELVPDKEEYSYTVCNFCSSLCNVQTTTHTINGTKRVVKLEGNPHSTLNRGKLCARGQSGLRQTYDTERIKTPLIRVEGSKRGEYNFRAATWEEAWEYIEHKTKAAKIQPWEWCLIGGWTSCVFYMNWSVPFAMANEVPNIIASPMQHCVTTGHLGTDSVTGNFNIHDEVLPDYDNARYILFVSNNASIAAVSTARMVRFARARKNGARAVALDPRLSETAAKSDEWIAIRPGTDLDFCLAMLKEMLEQKYYDAEFLRIHTNMPFLTYKDESGQWRLMKDEQGRPMALEETTAVAHTLPAHANANHIDAEGKNFFPALYTPQDFTIDGKRLVTVLEAQLEEIKHCTAEWAEKTTGVKAEMIRRIAHDFGTTRPAIIDPGWHGARFGNVMMLRRVQAMIQALTGGIDKRGGWIMSGEFHHKAMLQWEASQKGEEVPAPLVTKAGMGFVTLLLDAFFNPKSFSHGRPAFSWAYSMQQRQAGKDWVAVPAMADEGLKEAVEGDLKWNGEPYQLRGLFINAANPVRHYYSDTYWKQALSHENMELVIVLDVLPSDTIPYADVILPHSTYLERNEPTLYGNGVNHDLGVTTRYAAIEPLYDSWESPDVLLRLTELISGKTDAFLGSIEQLTGLPAASVKASWDHYRKQGVPSPFSVACREISFREYAKKLHISVEELDKTLREKGVYYETRWPELLEHAAMPYKLPMFTGSGRVEFYSSLFEGLQGQGAKGAHFSALATPIAAECRQAKTMDQPLDEDEFYFIYGKTPTVSYGSTNNNNPVLAAINTFKHDIYTGVWIHPDRAKQLGIAQGDTMLMANTLSGQQAKGKAYITPNVRRDTLFIHSSFGVENKQLKLGYAAGGVAINKLIPHRVEPVVAGFRSQEFTIRVSKLESEGKGGVV